MTVTTNNLLDLDIPTIRIFTQKTLEWLKEYVFISETISQLSITAILFIIAYFISKKPIARLDHYIHSRWDKRVLERHNEEALFSLILPFFWLILQWTSVAIAAAAELPYNVLSIIAKLLTAWIIIRLTSSLVRYPTSSKMIAIIGWSIAALSIIGLLDPTIKLMDNVAFEFGSLRISVLTVVKGIISLTVLLWLAAVLSRMLEKRIYNVPYMTPSAKVLLTKFLKITLITFALLIGVNSLGIDLTALTVFGGAIGLGLGFGLQKVVSNLVSGVILLMDKSVKPGDVIELGDTYGWVNSLSARYVSVLTRDGYEHLIPNEDLITGKVINWSYSSTKVRLKIPARVSYNADIRKAMELMLQAANEHPRILKTPEVVCRLIEFGESAVKLELRIWINDPIDGINNIRSDVLLSIWDKFHEHHIEIPFPQQDIRLKSSDELKELLTILKSNR